MSTLPTILHLQQRTSRSFVTTESPDYLAAWLLDQGFRATAKSDNPHEYARFSHDGELVILYWNGSVVVGGDAWRQAARRLEAICESAPVSATLFDLLDQESEVSR